MKVMILGGDGMLGHQLITTLSTDFDVVATYRLAQSDYEVVAGRRPVDRIYNVRAQDFDSVRSAVEESRPDVIVNSIGIVKQREDALDAVVSIEVNTLFPHRVSALAQEKGIRFINVSTDCVFSGDQGMYREEDVPDASDIYGRSKLLGETVDGSSLTLRTSIVGLELKRKGSLVEWFLAQEGQINGFGKAIYSGLTTPELARVIEKIISQYPESSGLYHVSSDPISKFDLLCGLRDRLELDIDILRDEKFENDKSLDSSRFQTEFSYTPPSWDAMLDELASQIRERNK